MNKCTTLICASALAALSIFQFGCNSLSNYAAWPPAPGTGKATLPATPPATPPATYSKEYFQSVLTKLPDDVEQYAPEAEGTTDKALAALILQRDFLNMSLNEIEELNDLMAEINTLLAKALDDVRSGHKIQESVLADLNNNLKKLNERVQIVRYQEQEYGETIAAQHIYKPETATIEDMETIYLGDIRESVLSQEALQKQLEGFKGLMNQKGLNLSDTFVVLNNAKVSNSAIKKFHLNSTATAQVTDHQINFHLEDLTTRSESLARGTIQAKSGMALATTGIGAAAVAIAINNTEPNSVERALIIRGAPAIAQKAIQMALVQLEIDPKTMQEKADKAAADAQRFKAFDAQARKKIQELQQGLDKMGALNDSTQKLVDELEKPLQKEIAERMRTDADLAKLYASEQTRTDNAIANGTILLSAN